MSKKKLEWNSPAANAVLWTVGALVAAEFVFEMAWWATDAWKPAPRPPPGPSS